MEFFEGDESTESTLSQVESELGYGIIGGFVLVLIPRIFLFYFFLSVSLFEKYKRQVR